MINPTEGLYALLLNITAFGVPKLVQHVENLCAELQRSPFQTAVFLNAETSSADGPRNTPRPRFP